MKDSKYTLPRDPYPGETRRIYLFGRFDPKLVQHVLGHARITVTLDRYSHWIPNMERHAADGMDEALG
jgi:integrase